MSRRPPWDPSSVSHSVRFAIPIELLERIWTHSVPVPVLASAGMKDARVTVGGFMEMLELEAVLALFDGPAHTAQHGQ